MVTVAIKPTFSHISPLRWTAAPGGLTANFDLNGTLKRYSNKNYQELEKRLDIEEDPRKETKNYRKMNNRYISTTDPEASIVRVGKTKLRYHTHRAVDPAAEIITAKDVTTGDVNEAHRMNALIDAHQENTETAAKTIVGDSKYGTIKNYLSCHDRGIKAHIPDLKRKQQKSGLRSGIYSDNRFFYDKESDIYECPAGKRLKRRKVHNPRDSVEYAGSKKECVRAVAQIVIESSNESSYNYCINHNKGRE